MAKNRGAAQRRYSSEVWQVGAARLPKWVLRSDGEVCQGWMAVCLRGGSKFFQISETGPEETVPELLEGVVSKALQQWRTRPWRIQVSDPAWASALESALAPRGLAVEVETDLPLLHGLLETLSRRLAVLDPRPGVLTGDGVTPDRLAALARAAAALMAASGWRHLDEDDLIRIEAPETEAGLGFFTLSHAGGRSAPELTFFPDARTFETALFEDCDFDADLDDLDLDESDFLDEEEDFEGAEEAGNAVNWALELLPPSAAPFADVELWLAQGLPWAGERLLPVAMLMTDNAVVRPDRRQLAFFEGLLAALAAASEEDLDAGRWEAWVSTAEGEVRFVLALPGVLEPDDSDLEPGEEPLPPEAFDSPQDRAEYLLDRAQGARGRRAVLLAREALEAWPECAGAYCFLASRAPDLDSTARLYEMGIAAGERAMAAGAVEPRPCMQARSGLAEVRVAQGRLAEAVEHYQEMLRLNPNDNQGVRHTLVNLLIELGRDEEAWELADSYPGDGALLEFPRALLFFRREGDSPEARKALKKAVQINRFVPGALLGDFDPPLRGGFYSPLGEDEAGVYLDLARSTWEDTEGALDWLRKRTTPPPRPARRKGKKGKKKRR